MFELWATERIQQLLALAPELLSPASFRSWAAGILGHQDAQILEFGMAGVEAAAGSGCRPLVGALELGERCFDNLQGLEDRVMLVPQRRKVVLAAVEGVDVGDDIAAYLQTERDEPGGQACHRQRVCHGEASGTQRHQQERQALESWSWLGLRWRA